MTTAVDTNVLLDFLAGDAPAVVAASEALSRAVVAGPVVICPVVYAELAAGFEQEQPLLTFLDDLGIELNDFSERALWHAGDAWRSYRQRRGRSLQCPQCGNRFDLHCPTCSLQISWRQHLITDFLIGAHAFVQADRLITRDPGYYRTYFPRLELLVPGDRLT